METVNGARCIRAMCFWCGGDAEALELPKYVTPPKDRVIVNYSPCDACKQKTREGVWIIEVQDEPYADEQFAISAQGGPEVYPTGQYVVMKRAGVPLLFNEEAAERILKEGKAMVRAEHFRKLLRLGT